MILRPGILELIYKQGRKQGGFFFTFWNLLSIGFPIINAIINLIGSNFHKFRHSLLTEYVVKNESRNISAVAHDFAAGLSLLT